MRPFSKPILRAFWTAHPPAKEGLRTWWDRASEAEWRTFADVRRDYASVDLVKGPNGEKLVFNIGGDKYRLVVLVEFGKECIHILWVGTHAEYDELDVKAL